MVWVTNLNKCILILYLVLSINFLYSKDFETYLENYFRNRTPSSISTIDISQLQDQFDYFSTNKININKSTIKKLMELPLVTEVTIKELIKSRKFHSEFELIQRIDSLNEDEIVKFVLKECLTIEERKAPNFNTNYIIRNQSNLQQNKGLVNNHYLGSQLSLYQKLNIKSNKWELYTILDKDAGELSLIDFSSYSLKFDNDKLKFIVGDYNLSFGLGNLLDQSFMSLKNTDFINTAIKYGYGASQNKSTLENNFFRGLYTEFLIPFNYDKSFKIASFYSNFNRSATIDENAKVVTSIYNSGYYRTQSEIDKIGKLNEQYIGIDAEYNSYNFQFGLLFSYLNYSDEIHSKSFGTFSGKQGLLSSIYGSYNLNNESIKFEFALDANQNISLRTNYLHRVYDNLNFLSEFRFAEPNYRAPYANNFGEQSYVSNEKGVLSGFIFNLNSMNISVFADYFNTEYKTFTTTMPVRGVQYYLDIQFKQKDVDYGLRVNYKKKSDSFKIDSINSNITTPYNTLNARLDVSKYFGEGFSFRGKLEFSYVLNKYSDANTGSLIQLEFKKKDIDLNLYYGISYTIFNTNDFETVIYNYQYQVPGLAYVYPYYMKGNNISAFVKYNIMEQLDLWIRYNNLFKNNNESIGSGNEEIIGNNRSQLIFQLQFKVN